MIGVVASIFASLVALAMVVPVLAHGRVLLKVGVGVVLMGAVFLMAVSPLIELAVFGAMGAIPAAIFGAICCLPSFFLARRASRILERQGTDVVVPALNAVERLMGASILMLSYVGIVGMFCIAWERYPG
jgi:hypothetical protein